MRSPILPMTATPVSLLDRLRRSDDRDAWSRFVELYTPLLYTWARRTGLQDADVADLLQDVFTTLVEQLPSFRYQPGGSFRAWLHTVLLNRWRALRRRKQSVQAGMELLDTLPGPVDPVLPSLVEEREELLQRALRLLEGDFEPTTWQAFRQSLLLGRPIADVARELGLTANAVYVARSRVLKRLRAELAGLFD